MIRTILSVGCMIAAILISVPVRAAEKRDAAAAHSVAAKWGDETLAKIRGSFFMPHRGLYAEQINDGKKPHPSWIWDASIQLGALCAAARVEPDKYLPQVKAYAVALRAYRTMNHDRPGLDVNPPPKTPDRYYDDNAWICMSLLEAYDLTHDRKDFGLAMDAYHFTMSGEDPKSGGIYWHEDQTRSKNACSSGPAMLAALELHRITGKPEYLATARRLYAWTCDHLQDQQDGLVYDSVGVPSGQINKAKFTYNSATLLRAGCILFHMTHEQKYLDDARRVAESSEHQFVRESDGIITGSGKLGVKLIEAFLEIADTDHNDHWRQVVARCITSLRTHRNDAGWYPQDWQSPLPDAKKPVRLIDQSAPARAYWLAAEHGVSVH